MSQSVFGRPRRTNSFARALPAAAVALIAMTPAESSACACGCNVFEVGTRSMLPTGAGGTVFLEYDYMNQTKNWSGTSKAPAEDNDDKNIRSNFYTAGLQYMFNRSWGVEVTVPYASRHFTTTDEDTGGRVGFDNSDFGDVRLRGIYTGFSPDLSTGVTFGVKLPTGDFGDPHFDRDTSIGSGSTDLLIGGFHRQNFGHNDQWGWFAQAEAELPVATQSYRPGEEVDGAAGVQFNGISLGAAGRITPILQVIGSLRLRDNGAPADKPNSGYERVLISPGLEYDVGRVMFYGDVELPVYQRVNGDQLTPPVLFKFIVSYMF